MLHSESLAFDFEKWLFGFEDFQNPEYHLPLMCGIDWMS